MGQRAKFFVAVDVFVIRDGKILLGKRKGAFGAGFWGLPGGHLEEKEEMRAAGARELKEETGLDAGDLEFVSLYNNNIREEHYVHVTLVAKNTKGEPHVTEPNKCEEWRWFDLAELPRAEILWIHLAEIDFFLEKRTFIDHS